MAKAPAAEQWLIFVDTNIFLDFYRIGGESADRQLKALEKHKDLIITGDQVRMEFLKNRQAVIVEGIRQLKKPGSVQFPPIIGDYQPASMLKKHLKDAENKFKKVKERIEKVLNNPSQNDPVYQAVQRIFNHKSPYNLTRPDKQRFAIRSMARKRFMLGYPPRKKTDTSIGDAINWEWIIKCAQTSNENHHILIVSRDGDYGITYGNETILNDWLRREFKDRVSRKRKIELTNKLTVALKKLAEVVSIEDEKEEERVLQEPPPYNRSDRSATSELLSKDPDIREFIEMLIRNAEAHQGPDTAAGNDKK